MPLPFDSFDLMIFEEIMTEVAAGRSIQAICDSDERYPDKATFFRWLIRHPEHLPSYEAAKELRAEALLEECLPIAVESRNDYIELTSEKTGKTRLVPTDQVARDRLRVDTRLELASKQSPKKYGRKLDVTTDGKALNLTDTERGDRIAAILDAARARRDRQAPNEPVQPVAAPV